MKKRYVIVPILCLIFIAFLIIQNQRTVKKIKLSPFLTTNGTELVDHGKRYTFVGFNMYQIASLPGHNAGCGGYTKNIDKFFSTLRPHSLIRMWAWQGSMAINPKTKKLDWAGIDRVMQAAKKYKQRLIISLGTQSGQCDDGQWKDSTWYQEGFKKVYDPQGITPLSYWDYIQHIVRRYKNAQVIGMWELMNEPETSDCVGFTGAACYGHQLCSDHTKAAQVLRHFYDTVGGKIKAIDPNHLIESGLIGTGQCGSDNENYTLLHKSSAIDVASYHDYNDDTGPLPGDQWNGLSIRLKQMKIINKPLIIGEVGMLALQGGGNCMTLDQRAKNMKAKMDAMFRAGVAGFLPWNRSPDPDTSCNFDIGNDDPLAKMITTYTL